jgi:hypothetical protein
MSGQDEMKGDSYTVVVWTFSLREKCSEKLSHPFVHVCNRTFSRLMSAK